MTASLKRGPKQVSRLVSSQGTAFVNIVAHLCTHQVRHAGKYVKDVTGVALLDLVVEGVDGLPNVAVEFLPQVSRRARRRGLQVEAVYHRHTHDAVANGDREDAVAICDGESLERLAVQLDHPGRILHNLPCSQPWQQQVVI